jgi:hypothetical protein
MSSPSKASFSNSANPESNSETIDFIEQVRVNQKKLSFGARLKTQQPWRIGNIERLNVRWVFQCALMAQYL